MTDALHHDHADDLLRDRTGLPELQAKVQSARESRGLTGIRLTRHTVDFDVPIPLILKVEGYSRLELDDAQNVHAADLHVDLWGEAYDKSYGTKIRLVVGEERSVLLHWPDERGDVARTRWTDGVARLSELLARPLDPAALLHVCAAAVPPPLREIWTGMTQDAVG